MHVAASQAPVLVNALCQNLRVFVLQCFRPHRCRSVSSSDLQANQCSKGESSAAAPPTGSGRCPRGTHAYSAGWAAARGRSDLETAPIRLTEEPALPWKGRELKLGDNFISGQHDRREVGRAEAGDRVIEDAGRKAWGSDTGASRELHGCQTAAPEAFDRSEGGRITNKNPNCGVEGVLEGDTTKGPR